MLKPQPAALCFYIVLSLGLSACGGSDEVPGEPSSTAAKAAQPSSTAQSAQAPAMDEAKTQKDTGAAAAFNLADGPDVCFRAIAKHLGADAKVSEITSFFSAGKEIEPSHIEPAGEMTTCTVQYQDPNDSRKLLRSDLDLESGEFGPPNPVEITVTGGNAADFKLEDYVIPLSKVDAAALTSVMEAQKSRLSGVFSRYAWSGVRLSAPGAFSNTHTLRLDVAGRLASNDLRQGGYASVSIDGKKITADHLMP
ncbi:hypothetical protein M2650_09270 [Luteimonas sp. SX5]|uniref:Uncharacterized protein n=1 Tax=Luteimonas galliterrae TaxID=2940486 RepID=A0ABT0MKR7_9GAMM|nr:hypothetical protein [Luteimonas galliterrae]MCL1634819.1 hypothetical protein [Luteimonas galliterrae]